MKAIILAAGRGSRMGSLTEEKPKCLTAVHGKPLIQHQLDALSAAGIQQIALVTGYKSECLANYGAAHFHNPQWSQTNMVASLLCARTWLEEDDCLVSYSDIFYSADIIKLLMECNEEVCVSYDPHWLKLWSRRFAQPLDDAETFRLDEHHYLLEIGKKAQRVDEIQGQYMGLLKFTKEFWRHFFRLNDETINLYKTDMTSFLHHLILKGCKIKAIANQGAWGEIDQPADLDAVMNEL